MLEAKKLAVTGATGYIGRRLCRLAVQQGWSVVALSRSSLDMERVTSVEYELGREIPAAALRGCHAVVHLAADTRKADVDIEHELDAAKQLISAARAENVQVVFVSSQTARPDAPTNYGRSKFQVERLVLESGGIVVRPGLVYGGPERGLFGRLCNIVRALPILPAFMPSPKVQPIHVDDLACALLAACASRESAPSTLCIAASNPVTFTQFLRAISAHRARKVRLFVPVPAAAVVFALVLAGRVLHRFGFDPRQILSLFDLPPMDTEASLTALGISPRALSSGMHPTGRIRRRLLSREGFILLRYVLKQQPNKMLVSRYVRALEIIKPNKTEVSFKFWAQVPFAVPLLDGPRRTQHTHDFTHRLDIAYRIAEASRSINPFIKINASSKLATFAGLASTVALEAILFLPRLLIGQLLNWIRRKET